MSYIYMCYKLHKVITFISNSHRCILKKARGKDFFIYIDPHIYHFWYFSFLPEDPCIQLIFPFNLTRLPLVLSCVSSDNKFLFFIYLKCLYFAFKRKESFFWIKILGCCGGFGFILFFWHVKLFHWVFSSIFIWWKVRTHSNHCSLCYCFLLGAFRILSLVFSSLTMKSGSLCIYPANRFLSLNL